jgi:hypothetical protein
MLIEKLNESIKQIRETEAARAPAAETLHETIEGAGGG